MCIIAGGNIDLSVGSVVALVGALAGVLIVNLKLNIYLSILICLLVGLLLGAWQAFWIAYMRIPPFIVTLAGMLTFRGLRGPPWTARPSRPSRWSLPAFSTATSPRRAAPP